jgi:hypothetical protein
MEWSPGDLVLFYVTTYFLIALMVHILFMFYVGYNNIGSGDVGKEMGSGCLVGLGWPILITGILSAPLIFLLTSLSNSAFRLGQRINKRKGQDNE